MVSTTVFFINCKMFKYGIEKNIFSDVSPKNSFLSRIWSKNIQKTKMFIQNFFVEWFFPTKIERIDFWEHSGRYQRTLMFPTFFFPFWTAYLPWTQTLLYRLILNEINEVIINLLKCYTVCIRTRLGISSQIYTFTFRSSLGLRPWQLLQAKGYIWPYIPRLVLTLVQYSELK